MGFAWKWCSIGLLVLRAFPQVFFPGGDMISENLVTLDTLDRHDVTRRHLGILGSFRV